MWLFRCRESWAVFRGVLSAVQLRSAEHGKVQGTASAGHGKCRARQVQGTASAGLSRLRREFLLSWQKEPKPLSPTQSGAV
ncbi:hypothetical protein, partial [Xanthomonas campestris]